MPLHQGLGIVVSRRAMVGRQGQHRLQQQFRIIQHVARDPDLGQKPHRLRMIAMPQEEGADDVFRRRQIAVGEQGCRRHHLGRQIAKRRDMGGGGRRIVGIAGQAIDALQHAPARGQGRIDVHRAQQAHRSRVARP